MPIENAMKSTSISKSNSVRAPNLKIWAANSLQSSSMIAASQQVLKRHEEATDEE